MKRKADRNVDQDLKKAGKSIKRQTSIQSFFSQKSESDRELAGTSQSEPERRPSLIGGGSWGALIQPKRNGSRPATPISPVSNSGRPPTESSLLHRSFTKHFQSTFQDQRPPGTGSYALDGIRKAWWGAATSNLRGGGGKQADAKNLRYVLQTVLSFSALKACLDNREQQLLALIAQLRDDAFGILAVAYHSASALRWKRAERCAVPAGNSGDEDDSALVQDDAEDCNVAEAVRCLGSAGMVAVAALCGSFSDMGELLSVADETALYNTLSLNQLKLALSDNGAKHMLRGAATKALLLETVAKSLAAASTRKSKEAALPMWRQAMQRALGPCISIHHHVAETLLRAHRIFFIAAGYTAEQACGLLRMDMSATAFPCPQAAIDSWWSRDQLRAYEQVLGKLDLMDAATSQGDADTVYGILHTASDVLLNAACSRDDVGHGTREVEICELCVSANGKLSDAGNREAGLSSAFPVWCTIVFRAAQLLERDRRYSEALHYYRILLGAGSRRWPISDSLRPSAADPHMWSDLPEFPGGSVMLGEVWCRCGRDLEHLGSKNDALKVYEAGLADPGVKGAQRVALQKSVVKLSIPPRRWKVPVFAELSTPVKERRLLADRHTDSDGRSLWEAGGHPGFLRVEDYALHWYIHVEAGWKGMHSENGPLLMLVSLLLWDVMFEDPPPGEVNLPYQDAPFSLLAGLHRNPKYRRRIEDLISSVKADPDEVAKRLRSVWDGFADTLCIGVNWQRLPLDDMVAIAAGLGIKCLMGMLHTVARDGWAQWAGGLPDLLLWTSAEPLRAKLVEVKGPGDKLSDRQLAWLHLLHTWGVDAEVCYVAANQ